MGQWTLEGTYIPSIDEALRYQEEDRLRLLKRKKRKKKYNKNRLVIDNNLYQNSWLKLRAIVLSLFPVECFRCYSTENIAIDHVFPKSIYPDLALDICNLQILCKSCNSVKSNIDYTDYRTEEQRQILFNYKTKLNII